MKIEVTPFAPGVALEDVAFGTVVRRANLSPVYYLVVCPMDGSGRRDLVTLQGGTTKRVDQGTRVIPVDATLFVNEILS